MQISIVKNTSEGFNLAKNLLYEFCNSQTVLFLSGGSTPKVLYEDLAKEKKLKVGAVGLVDERFGQNFKLDYTNECMIEKTGLFRFFESKNIPVFNILNGKSLSQTTKEYGGVVLTLLKSKNKIGKNGRIDAKIKYRKDLIFFSFS
jgi:6-phosphogluconolactonase/glucosamine-6-phosphate isomerase/deaminase